jgi:hypothetical protein
MHFVVSLANLSLTGSSAVCKKTVLTLRNLTRARGYLSQVQLLNLNYFPQTFMSRNLTPSTYHLPYPMP